MRRVSDAREEMSRITQNSGGLPMTTMSNSTVSASQAGGDTLRTSQNGVSQHQRVFLQRDYRQGIAIRFMTDFPSELNGRVDPNIFDYTIKELNSLFEEAETFDCATFCESCIGFVTANLWWMCTDSKYEKALKRVSKFIADQNQRIYLPNGLLITDPVERGLRCLEITILAGESPRS